MRVLIVDDSLVTARILANILTASGRHEIVGVAKNGLDAIKLNLDVDPDVIFMDMNMPVMDGMTSMRSIRSTDKQVKLIMLTSLAGAGNVYGDAMKLNAVVVSKPFDDQQIVAAIEG